MTYTLRFLPEVEDALVGGAVVVAGLYYMIVVPGWQGNAPRLRRPWSVVVFVIAALLITLGIVFYVVKG